MSIKPHDPSDKSYTWDSWLPGSGAGSGGCWQGGAWTWVGAMVASAGDLPSRFESGLSCQKCMMQFRKENGYE
ncbi:MAG: hypothetical protein J6C98_00030 [Oscillospiraceae bacterium]|nr:hypothetical protein [Oscillospiraceae bacterium]